MFRSLRHAVSLSAALLLTGAIVAVVVTAGCGGNGGGGETRTPDASSTPNAISTDGTIILTSTGDLDALTVSEAAVGDEIVVTGSEWTNLGSVSFYLVTEEQTGRSFLVEEDAVKLGEVMPTEDGTISFRFRLADSYQTPNGDQVRIEAGEQWRLQACQNTEPVSGLRGAHCSARGPLTVVE